MSKATFTKICINTLKRMLGKSTKEIYNNIYQSDGKPTICDGCRMFQFNVDIPELPHTNESEDTSKFSSARVLREAKRDSGDPIVIPKLQEINKFIKDCGRKQEPYNICNDSWVNPKFIRDMLRVFPKAIVYAPQSRLDPIYFECDMGCGVILPVRIEKNRRFSK